MKDKTILLQAAPFCYGPISTTLNVVHVLAQYDYRLIIIDEGPTGDLIRRSDLQIESISVATSVPFSQKLCEVIDQSDLVISNTDPVFAAACVERGAEVVVIDTLFWMWDTLDDALLDCELYIVQDFAGVDEQCKRLGTPKNFVKVGPLIRPQAPPVSPYQREPRILVSLGGCDCTVVEPDTDPYPPMIIEILNEIINDPHMANDEFIVTTGEKTACFLSSRKARMKFTTLSNQEHLDMMRKAKAILLSPGLTGTMEVLEAETPVFFLPPQNYSQVLQLKTFRNAHVAPYSFNWSDVYPEFDLEPYLPEADAVNRVRSVIDRFVKDPRTKEVFRQKLVTFFQEGFQQHAPIRGRNLRQSFGMNGPEKAAYAIRHMFEGHE